MMHLRYWLVAMLDDRTPVITGAYLKQVSMRGGAK